MALISDGATLFTAPYVSSSASAQYGGFTFFAWVKLTSPTTAQAILGLDNINTSMYSTSIVVDSSSGFSCGTAADTSGASIKAFVATIPSANIWYPLLGTVTVTSAVHVASSIGSGSQTGSIGASTYNQIQFLGTHNGGNIGQYLASGSMLAECAIWHGVLSQQEQNKLVFENASPWNVRRDLLLCHMPLRNNVQDYGNNHFAFTQTGGVASTSPFSTTFSTDFGPLSSSLGFTGDHPLIEAIRPVRREAIFASFTTSNLSVSQAAETLSATASNTSTTNLFLSQAAQTISATATLTTHGALTANQAAETIVAAATPIAKGILAASQTAETLSATAVYGVTISSLTATQAANTLAATAKATVAGQLDIGALAGSQQSQTLNSVVSIVVPIVQPPYGQRFANTLKLTTPAQVQPSHSFILSGTYTAWPQSVNQFASGFQLYTPAQTTPNTSFIIAGTYKPISTSLPNPLPGEFAGAMTLFTPAQTTPNTSYILAGTYVPFALPVKISYLQNTAEFTSLTTTIPAYLYQQYSDDDDLQAFIDALNAMTQYYVTWFNDINLPVYTSSTIVGPLLDWVAQGLYGMTRPTLFFSTSTFVGPFNTYPLNTIAFDAEVITTTSLIYVVTDDIFKRIMTWNFYRGDGYTFNIRWLKRRIARFLGGTNGVPINVDETYQINVTIAGTVVTINITHGSWPIDTAYVLQAAILDGAVQLPFQFTYVVTITP